MTAPTVEDFVGTAESWDAFCLGSAAFTHCHLHGWGEVIRNTFGHRVQRWCVRDGGSGELQGVLQLVRVKGPIFGDFLVSLPYLNYGGPLGDDGAVRALAEAAMRQAEADGVDLLELRSLGPLPVDLPFSTRKVTVVLPLPSTPESLFKQFDAKLRSQIRKPQKENVEVLVGPEQADDFYRVFAEHMRDLGTPALPRRLFTEFLAVFRDDAIMMVARIDGKPVAAGCGLFAGGEFEMIWASALHAHSRAAPNMLVYWRAMELAIARGTSRFNFGRCTVGAGTHRFKRQWTGSYDVPLHWYQHGRGAAKTPSPDDAKYAWGPRLWKRLPLAIANRVGPLLIRGIP